MWFSSILEQIGLVSIAGGKCEREADDYKEDWERMKNRRVDLEESDEETRS